MKIQGKSRKSGVLKINENQEKTRKNKKKARNAPFVRRYSKKYKENIKKIIKNHQKTMKIGSGGDLGTSCILKIGF